MLHVHSFLSHQLMARPRPANPVPTASECWTGPVTGSGVVFPSLWPQLQSSLFTLSGNCQRAPPVWEELPVFWPWGSCQTSQTSLDPMNPDLLLRLKPSHLLFGTTNHSSWNPAPVSALGLIQYLSPVLRVSPKSLHFPMTYPMPVPKEHMGGMGMYVREIRSSR